MSHEKLVRRTLMMQIAGTRGGPARLKILQLLIDKPLNTNEIAKRLSIDYKTAEYHVRTLEKSGFLSSSAKPYDSKHDISPLLRAYPSIMNELVNMGKSK